MKKILIIGGAGYVGTKLSNKLSDNKKYKVIVYDTFWFGNFLKTNIKKIKGNILNIDKKVFKNIHTVINLAYLSNDPLCEVDARATWETGPLSNFKILEYCKEMRVKHFIFASSGSIYGLKKEKKVTEDLGLDPITDYNKSKMICEKVTESYKNFFKTTILRPATVCGFSKRLRLDLVLNIFCHQAFYKKKIIILGGKQVRPLIHIDDMVRAYEFVIKNKIYGCFNVGFENLNIKKLAKSVQKIIPCKIIIKKSNDIRSYRMCSDKILNLKFKPLYNHVDAIIDLKNEFKKGFKPKPINWNLNHLLKKKVIIKK